MFTKFECWAEIPHPFDDVRQGAIHWIAEVVPVKFVNYIVLVYLGVK
jgi:hypothetical protein